MSLKAIERAESLQRLLDEYAQDLDSPITIRLRRRDWMTLAVLWWYFGGGSEMDRALDSHRNGYGELSLSFEPCMQTNCQHGPECGREREALEKTLMKFLEKE